MGVGKPFSSCYRINSTTDCWEWQKSKTNVGYGWRWYKGRMHYAHRISWLLHFGPIPSGLHVLHECDNPSCVNPNHLFLGTNYDNVKDRDQKGRQAKLKGELHGMVKLTKEQVVEIRANNSSLGRLAAHYGVSKTQISRIKSYCAWGHVQ